MFSWKELTDEAFKLIRELIAEIRALREEMSSKND